jgi:hypothetical protein
MTMNDGPTGTNYARSANDNLPLLSVMVRYVFKSSLYDSIKRSRLYYFYYHVRYILTIL